MISLYVKEFRPRCLFQGSINHCEREIRILRGWTTRITAHRTVPDLLWVTHGNVVTYLCIFLQPLSSTYMRERNNRRSIKLRQTNFFSIFFFLIANHLPQPPNAPPLYPHQSPRIGKDFFISARLADRITIDVRFGKMKSKFRPLSRAKAIHLC